MIKIHSQKQRQIGMKQSAKLRAKDYSARHVMNRLLLDLGLPSHSEDEGTPSSTFSATIS